MKYGAATNMVAFEFHADLGLYIPLFRKEIPRGEFTLDNAVNAIIELDKEFNFDFIYVDRGYGEHQVETLRKYGLANPQTRMHNKVIGIHFNETIMVRDPHKRQKDKKPAKPWMVNNAVLIFERGKIALNPKDTLWFRQLENYRVVGYSSYGAPKYNDDDEHIIDAMMLALWGLVANFTDIVKASPGKAAQVVPNLVAKATDNMLRLPPQPVTPGTMPRSNALRRGTPRVMGRGGGMGPLSRMF